MQIIDFYNMYDLWLSITHPVLFLFCLKVKGVLFIIYLGIFFSRSEQ